MGSVSIRKHIQWGTDPPSEPTSTLVLTSPRRHFVDIRPLKTALQGPASDCKLIAFDQLDWAFGGTSSSTSLSRPDGTQVSHAVFCHWVDSRSKNPENDIVDEGDMIPQPDGLMLETGIMINPATGERTDYEELWSDEDIADEARCVVLQLHLDEQEKRGMFVLLGRFAQCVLRMGDDVVAERWECGSNGPMFARIFKVGSERSPTLDDLLGAALEGPREGDEVKTATGTWKVVEKTT